MDEPTGVRRLDISRGSLRRSRRRGVSLVLVMSVILILTVVATGFVAFTSQDMKASQTTYEQNETYFLAEAGIDYGLFLLKHNMLVYPAAPAAWVDGRATILYDAGWPVISGRTDGDANLDLRGSLISLNRNTSPPGQEHVVIADLGYTPANNWMNYPGTCGTFTLTQQVGAPSGNAYTITFTSTGAIKAIPSGTVTTNPSAYANVATWTIVSQRTVQAQVTVNNLPYASAAAAFPTAVQSIEVKEFNEKFR